MSGLLRITGGLARGIQLQAPAGREVRPATDFMRQAVFSSLGGIVQEAVFLDLFAGTGAYGLEALSRGARGGVFIDKSHRSIEKLQHNLQAVCKSMGAEPDCCDVFQLDCLTLQKLPASAVMPAEGPMLIFMDPPYELVEGKGDSLLGKAAAWLEKSTDSRIIFEMPAQHNPVLPAGLRLVKRLGRTGHGQPAACICAVEA